MKWTNRVGKWLFSGAALTTMAAGGAGCLSRPVGTGDPTTKVNFTTSISQQQVDKVDLLFAIDNSASMGDKQAILAEAVPRLLEGLLRPKCVDQDGKASGDLADPTKTKEERFGCPAGFDAEFKPVTDMHIGVISSSLGAFGGGACEESGRGNDQAHLLNIVKEGGSLAEAKPSNFLAWYPSVEDNKDKNRHPTPPVTGFDDPTALSAAFAKLVVGVDQTGCGLEAQLESVYRFLIQPDPWAADKIAVKGSTATLGADDEIDTTLLKQRADFLRPDSLVAVVMLTDEDDSYADPLSVGGQGWAFMANAFPGSTQARSDGKGYTAPRATSACADDPGSADCTSCGFAAKCDQNTEACKKLRADPNCQKNGGYYTDAEDSLNVRFFHMKQRFGVDPQFPIKRYVDGFTKTQVPDRSGEHVVTPRENGAPSVGPYLGQAKCTNPLFAKELPTGVAGDEICKLQVGTRSPSLVFFAVVGGVPPELLHFDPTSPEKSKLTGDDWNKIVGADPAKYNYDGIDKHMVQSTKARKGMGAPTNERGNNGDPNDPVGRDWDTQDRDLQYACTFNLKSPVQCTAVNQNSCDCNNADANPPLCGTEPNTQVKAKAYPTSRQFQVVRALGDQGIAASLCPIQLDDDTKDTYGYNPAVKNIIDRLKNALTAQCLPQKLTRDAEDKSVPCLVLAQLDEATDSCESYGLQPPAKEILDKFLEQQRERNAGVPGAEELANRPVCEVPQIKDGNGVAVDKGGTCRNDSEIGWCYVENEGNNKPAGQCPQALLFTAGSARVRAVFSLQCIQQFNPGEAAGDNK